jgi:hypothetical protein
MRTFSHLRILFGLCSFAATLAGADPKHPAPTAADIAATQAAIADLAKGPVHDLNTAMDKLNARLDNLEAETQEVGRNVTAVNLPELVRREAANRAAASDLSARQDNLENGLASAQARVAEGAAAAGAAIRTLQQQQANADARFRAAQQSWDDHLDAVAKTLTAQISSTVAGQEQAEARDSEALARAGLAALAVLAVLTLAIAWIGRRSRVALQREIGLALARLGMDFRQSPAAAAPPAPANGQANFVSHPDWSGLEARLRHLVEFGENGRVAGALRKAPPGTHDSEKSTVSVGPQAEPAVASRLLWPADFLDPESPLSRWRFLLEGHLANDEHPALPVLTHLLAVRALLKSPTPATPAEIAAALFRLSESLHAYWHSLTDLSSEDRQQASAAWLQGMRAMMATATPQLDVREIRPGTRVDPDLMHPVIEGPGNHLNVADVFSWAVIDRAGDRFRVLYRAQIAST